MTKSKMKMSPKPYQPVTKWLHAGLVLGVIFQLTCDFLMTHPEHVDGGHGGVAIAHVESVTEDMYHQQSASKDTFGESLMSVHRAGGVFVALIVLANFIWAVIRRGVPRKRQMAVLVSAMHWSESWQILKNFPLCLWVKVFCQNQVIPYRLLLKCLAC